MSSDYVLDRRSEHFVKTMIESGRYGDTSDVVREGLRLLEEREALAGLDVAELRRMVEEGRLSGPSDQTGEAFLAALEEKYRAMATDGKRRR